MRDVRNAVHHDFQRNRHLLLDLFRGDSRPLRDDLNVVVRYVGIGFDGKLMEGNRAPAKEQDGRRKDKEAVFQREIYQLADHLRFLAESSALRLSLIVDGVLQGQRVRYDLLARLQPG